jgi:hypothetical protein
MIKNAKEDILTTPEWSYLEFGDGYIAQINGAIEKEEDGKKMVEFLLKPSILLRKRHGISDEMLNRNGQIDFKVFKGDLIPLNLFDDSNRKWMYIKSFKHDDTPISQIAWDLRKRLEEMENRIMIMEGELIWAYEQLQLAKSNPSEFIAQGLEIFERIGSRFADMIPSKKKDKDDMAMI